MFIVPDPAPRSPLLLVGAGAALLAGLAFVAFRRRRRRRTSSRGAIVLSSARRPEAPVIESTGRRIQNRGLVSPKQR